MEILKFTEKSLLFLLLRGASTLKKSINNTLGESNLNFNQALILIVLYSERGRVVTPSVLVEALDLPKSVISQLLSALEEEKLIKRKLIADDARKFGLALTAKGKQKSILCIKLIDQLDKDLESGYSKSELNNLLKLSKRLS